MKAALILMNAPIIQELIQNVDMFEIYNLCLNEFRKNLAANPGRSSLMRSYSYASADDRPALFAGFPLIFVPFMQHAGSPPVNRV